LNEELRIKNEELRIENELYTPGAGPAQEGIFLVSNF